VSEKKQIKLKTILTMVIVGWLTLSSSCVWSLDLDTVFENTAVVPPARVGFREERHNPLLKEPLVLTGYLEYLEAGRLRKVVETPFEEAFLIDADQIEIKRNGETRKLSLKKTKFLRIMLGGIEAILAGRADNLASVFRYELSGTSSSWSLRLEPLSQSVSKHMSNIRVTGDDKSVISIRFELQEGEWHLMEIIDANSEP
jgi:hypothetical protein